MTTPPPPSDPPTVHLPTAVDAPADDLAPETEAKDTSPNRRLRWLVFNASAAAAGHLAIWSVTGDPMAGVHLVARMATSVPQLGRAVLTGVAAWAGWKGARLIRLDRLPGGSAFCIGAAFGAALWGQGTTPLIADAMAVAHPWSTLLAPLLTTGPVAAACWRLLDSRTTQARAPIRWVARVPLATVVLSSALYAPGALL
ncbi:hypothetical protein RM550_07300 [Streptomyces sp. DSM 41527]|uniref:DUF3995 domain-containing protein n=1 Tax=Streptomyces mooreae TaxID=3075523 RepID=A0ABU2T2T8_9ACTN|nr:hypothetical protein [Streptomyces sp. DSM 41527]MDT0455544.1 hypothetical protein [Streptomyces sp. DSM 41527]